MTAPIHQWVEVYLPPDVQVAVDRLSRADDVLHIAIMPDVHLAQTVCVGTVFATERLVYPDAIGGDIGCGMAAMALDATARSIASHQTRAELFQTLQQSVPIQQQRSNGVASDLEDCQVPASDELSDPALRHMAERAGLMQLGTLGGGNHFLELQQDQDDGQLWLMVHSGSRTMGQAIRESHVKEAQQAFPGMRYLEADSSEGQAYLRDMQWARRYAAASRLRMLLTASEQIESLLGWQPIRQSLFDCDHNHIAIEEHFGREVFVHRKGAMRAGDGEAGIVPGSMATPSYHVRGRGLPQSLHSSAHGAGRRMSRSQARQRFRRDDLERQLASVFFDPAMLGGLRDEAPGAYKDIQQVMRAQRKLVRVVRTLLPILSYKGSASPKKRADSPGGRRPRKSRRRGGR